MTRTTQLSQYDDTANGYVKWPPLPPFTPQSVGFDLSCVNTNDTDVASAVDRFRSVLASLKAELVVSCASSRRARERKSRPARRAAIFGSARADKISTSARSSICGTVRSLQSRAADLGARVGVRLMAALTNAERLRVVRARLLWRDASFAGVVVRENLATVEAYPWSWYPSRSTSDAVQFRRSMRGAFNFPVDD